MFKLKDNVQIGKYLRTLIDRKYSSHRAFCREYLKLANMDVDAEEIRKQGNRLSQILKGKKGLQIDDLPIYSELLGVSCEQILSCGKTAVVKRNRVTNYSVALSKNKKDWDEYINRADKLILNYDEYGKSVIDYAFEFDNYDFLKYLVDEGYIWFVDNSKDSYDGFGYGAGTSIKRRDIGYTDTMMPLEIQYQDTLRTNMIAMAIRNKDFGMLDDLHAREIPVLYRFTNAPNNVTDIDQYKNPDLIDAIAEADDNVLEYFATPFKITNVIKDEKTYIFPFLGDVIDRLIRNNPSKAELVIRKCIHYNKDTFKELKAMIDKAYADYYESNKQYYFDLKELKKMSVKYSLDNLWITCNNRIVSYYYVPWENRREYYGMVTNIITANSKAQNPLLKELILELQESYNQIIDLKEQSNA